MLNIPFSYAKEESDITLPPIVTCYSADGEQQARLTQWEADSRAEALCELQPVPFARGEQSPLRRVTEPQRRRALVPDLPPLPGESHVGMQVARLGDQLFRKPLTFLPQFPPCKMRQIHWDDSKSDRLWLVCWSSGGNVIKGALGPRHCLERPGVLHIQTHDQLVSNATDAR